MSLINLEGISFQYPNGNRVLEGLSLRLEEGDKIGLLGENGTGKTTLFHIILGLLTPTKGEITIFGKRRETEQDFKKIRRAIGLLFQDSDDQLFCPTVMEDVAFGPLNMGMSHHEATERAEQTLEELGILRFRNRVPYQLSGGEKRLVSMATILSMRPEILLLDEPTTGLDEKTKERLISVLQSYPAKAWIIISHVQSTIEAMSNKYYNLNEGRMDTVSSYAANGRP
ncbi:MAG: ATP-binding cassette domain-containing protein [Desulfobulbaceae bacterium]|nr:ATP-binding cassette domain-containing protein [Desulfobulbaceae bacterium]